MEIRYQRKNDHLVLSVKTPDGPLSNGFEDIILVPDAVPELAWEDVDLQTIFLGKSLRYPVLINALTGGTESAYEINKTLAVAASRFGLAMAVGSMTIALEETALLNSFAVARDANPNGVIIANCGAGLEAAKACQLVDLIAADALQVHLNVAQELAMVEGDRDFRGILDNIARIAEDCPVPVIAKEVGFGLSYEAAAKLYRTGIRIIDNGGSGGTNFIAIEHQRAGNFERPLYEWGIPTAASLAEIVSLQLPLQIIATGGIRNSLDIAKAIAMGADLVGMSGWFLRRLKPGQDLNDQITGLLRQLQAIFLMCGACNCESLQNKPLLILGRTADWLRARSIDPAIWSTRTG